MDDAQLEEFEFLWQCVAVASRRELPMIAASCEETARPISGGLEFDVKLVQHTAVVVLPSGDAETKPGCDGMSENRKTAIGRMVSWTDMSHDKRQTTTEPEPYPT